MEKICIVKRRKIGFGNVPAFQPEPDPPGTSDVLTLQLTPEQMARIRSTEGFRNAYGTSQAPIFLSLRLETPFLAKMLTAAQVCDIIQISKTTLAKVVKSGAIKSHRIGRLRRFSSEDVMEYLTRGVEEVGLLRSIRTPTSAGTWER